MRWIVARIAVARTTRRSSAARVSAGREKPATRDHRPTYGGRASCAWRPAVRASASSMPTLARSRRSWRASSARFSARAETTSPAGVARGVRGMPEYARRAPPRERRATAASARPARAFEEREHVERLRELERDRVAVRQVGPLLGRHAPRVAPHAELHDLVRRRPEPDRRLDVADLGVLRVPPGVGRLDVRVVVA